MSSNKLILATTALGLVLAVSPAGAQGVKQQRGLSNSPIELMPAQDKQEALARDRKAALADEELKLDAQEAEAEAEDETDEEQTDAETVAPPAKVDSRPVEAPVVETRAVEEIAVSSAAHISLDTLGLYDEKSGGVAFDVWEGSDHARVRQLLGQVPDLIPSETLRKLVAKLLLSTTRPPESENIQQNVFLQRVDVLLRQDEVPQALRLLALVPQDSMTAAVDKRIYTARLLNGEEKWVCDAIGSALEKYVGKAPEWQKYSIFCLASAKNEAKAQLALDVLAEQKVEMDAGFLSLIEVMLGRSSKVEQRYNQPLALDDAAMIALSGKDAFPTGYLDKAPLPILRLVAENGGFAEALRAQAKQRLAIVMDQPMRERAAMKAWFARQFAAATDKAYDVEQAYQDMLARSEKKASEADNVRRRYRFYTMLQALGFSELNATVNWEHITFKDTPRITLSPVLRRELALAVDRDMKGEAVLLLAVMAGQVNDLALMDDAALADMVQALVQLGYISQAQALAVESMAALY